MRQSLFLLAILALTAGAPAVQAQTDDPPRKSPEELVTEGVQMLVQAMELFLKSVPQFGKPFVNENGDIVIPRLHPEAEKPKSQPAPEGQRRI